ncbi:MAG: alpha/beta fold hydrolase [Cyclobacteriaceae bacterium]
MKLVALIGGFLITILSWSQDFSGFRKINGAQLYFHIMGEGEPLVVIHGGPGLSYDYFLPHLRALSKNFKVVLFDLRANGKSAVPSSDSLQLSFFVEDIEGIREMLGAEKIHLMAHSWGALLAVAYASTYPKHVDDLILCSPVPLNKEYDKEMMEAQLSRTTGSDSTDRAIIKGSKAFREGKIQAFEKLMMLTFRNSFHKPSNFHKLQITFQPNYLASTGALYAGLGKDLMQYDYYPTLKGLSFPVLLLHGKHDAIPETAVQRMKDELGHGELEVFNKSGHFIFIEEPKKFTRTVTAFLKG